MDRRKFLRDGALAASGAAAALHAPYVIAQQKIKWRMVTTWTPALNVMQGSAQLLAKRVEKMSGGRFTIEVFPGGQLMKPLDCFAETGKGTVEAFMGASYYWGAREPALQWFCAVPFGLNPQGMASWLYHGDGLKLWEESYAAFGLVPRPGPSTGPQMAGWFRRKIDTVADLKGLKMRIPGLGGKVIEKAGGTVVLTPGGQIYGALERGIIDASEWVGPHDDLKLGLQNTAPYYYYPGWHEPGTTLEFSFNKKAYDALPGDLKQILDDAAAAVSVYGLTEYETANAIALARLRSEYKDKVELLQLPTPVLQGLRKLAAEVVKEESEKTPQAKRVYESFSKFQAQLGGWRRVSEGAYNELVAV
ncbi:MAG: ABC transporter substrate-binding protein [Gammaproteobacteria bacterium]|nr:ABC transporter substrate-binding protein [Gammaproteobacteria bacterium]